jgi:hypothetical protein
MATPNRKLPYVKALRLEPQDPNSPKPKMVETNEAKAFSRKAWENMFDKKGDPILKNFNWRFIESIPMPSPDDILLPKETGGKEMKNYKEPAQVSSPK